MTARGERTREHLIDVAEVLYGRRGFQNVSLREIQAAAEQRNAGVLHYHFGDRDGLLRAIVERHMPRIERRQEELLASIAPDGDLRSYVTVLVAPFAEYVDLGVSERAWVQLCAELLIRPSTTVAEIRKRSSTATYDAGLVIYQRMLEIVPPDIAVERAIAVPLGAIHVCADRARSLDHPHRRRAMLPAELFVANLVDVTTSAFAAEPGPTIAAHQAAPSAVPARTKAPRSKVARAATRAPTGAATRAATKTASQKMPTPGTKPSSSATSRS